MKYISLIFTSALIYCCSTNNINIEFQKMLLENDNNNSIVIKEDLNVGDLFCKLMENCNDSIIQSYSGDYSVAYDIITNQFIFNNEINDNTIILEILGFVCPASLLEISYYEFNIDYPNNISLENIKKHISKSTYNIDKQASIFNLIVPNEIKINELSDYIKIIIQGYINSYETYLDARYGNDITLDIKIKSIEEFKDMAPLRIRITPRSYYNVNVPN